jgi:hypothetical protein
MKKTIRARCYSDDRKAKAGFDAVGWFEYASDQDIINLAKCGWIDKTPAEQVTIYMADHDRGVAKVYKYLQEKNEGTEKQMGLVCHVNETAARKWIKEHRDYLIGQLRRKKS